MASEPVAPGAFCPWSRLTATRSSGTLSSTQTGTQNGVGSWDCPSTVNELHQTLPTTRETTHLSYFAVALSSPSPSSTGALHLWSLVFRSSIVPSFVCPDLFSVSRGKTNQRARRHADAQTQTPSAKRACGIWKLDLHRLYLCVIHP